MPLSHGQGGEVPTHHGTPQSSPNQLLLGRAQQKPDSWLKRVFPTFSMRKRESSRRIQSQNQNSTQLHSTSSVKPSIKSTEAINTGHEPSEVPLNSHSQQQSETQQPLQAPPSPTKLLRRPPEFEQQTNDPPAQARPLPQPLQTDSLAQGSSSEPPPESQQHGEQINSAPLPQSVTLPMNGGLQPPQNTIPAPTEIQAQTETSPSLPLASPSPEAVPNAVQTHQQVNSSSTMPTASTVVTASLPIPQPHPSSAPASSSTVPASQTQQGASQTVSTQASAQSQAGSTQQSSSSPQKKKRKPRRRDPEEYEYEPLDEHPLNFDRVGLKDSEKTKKKDLIRILTLHPGDGDAPVFCSLDVRQIPQIDNRGKSQKMYEYGKEVNVVKYQALSYAWGDKPPSRDLLIKSSSSQGYKKLKITESLYSALKILRDRYTEALCFWADAVCMNQDDDEEKSVQLTLMARIYKEATNVCVWLGPSDVDTECAFKLIDLIRETADFNDFVEEKTNNEQWIAFAKLLMKTWFSRRWVVQEISLATKAEIWCGNEHRRWQHFSEAVSLFVLVAERVKKRFAAQLLPDKFGDIAEFSAHQLVTLTLNVVSRDDSHRVLNKEWSLEYLVSKFTPFQAGEPRDIVYAMLSLAKDVRGSTAGQVFGPKPIIKLPDEFIGNRDPEKVRTTLEKVVKYLNVEKFPVDYGKDYLDVYLDFLNYTIPKSRSLDIICRPWGPRKADLKEYIIRKKTEDLEEKLKDAVDSKERKELTKQLSRMKRTLGLQIVQDEVLPSWIRPLNEASFEANFGNNHNRDDAYRWDRKNPDSLVGLPGESSYRASGRILPEWEFRRQGEHYFLSAKGFQLDEITDVHDAANGGTIPESWITYAKSTNRSLDESIDSMEYYFGPPTESKYSVPESFWRTMVAGRAPNTLDGKNPPPYYRILCQTMFSNAKGDINLSKDRTNTRNELHRDYLKRVEGVIFRRRLARLPKCDRLALLPGSSKNGDFICIIFGCSVPVVLRELPNESTTVSLVEVGKPAETVVCPVYRLIGECYVHGLMEGEAFNIRNDASKTERDGFYRNQFFQIR
jgi:Heterokaryon incompatibility protein (HET)